MPYGNQFGPSGLMNYSPNIAGLGNDFYSGVGALYTNTNISPI
jgi:hypothetical protein